jgi:hypothetical protein
MGFGALVEADASQVAVGLGTKTGEPVGEPSHGLFRIPRLGSLTGRGREGPESTLRGSQDLE